MTVTIRVKKKCCDYKNTMQVTIGFGGRTWTAEAEV